MPDTHITNLGQLDLAILQVRSVASRCKILPNGETVTLRGSRIDIPGQILSLAPSKIWKHKNTNYVSGEVLSTRIDVRALNLVPLKLTSKGVWHPNSEDSDDCYELYLKPINDAGPREKFEMEQIISGREPMDFEHDAISEASEMHSLGNVAAARALLSEILAQDLRCIDAHAHLGNWAFPDHIGNSEFELKIAKSHYEIGAGIGDLSIGNNFTGLLPWENINNRPYLRCLHGLGLCLWRMRQVEEARFIFERMLWLNPADNQGARSLMQAVDDGERWSSES